MLSGTGLVLGFTLEIVVAGVVRTVGSFFVMLAVESTFGLGTIGVFDSEIDFNLTVFSSETGGRVSGRFLSGFGSGVGGRDSGRIRFIVSDGVGGLVGGRKRMWAVSSGIGGRGSVCLRLRIGSVSVLVTVTFLISSGSL